MKNVARPPRISRSTVEPRAEIEEVAIERPLAGGLGSRALRHGGVLSAGPDGTGAALQNRGAPVTGVYDAAMTSASHRKPRGRARRTQPVASADRGARPRRGHRFGGRAGRRRTGRGRADAARPRRPRADRGAHRAVGRGGGRAVLPPGRSRRPTTRPGGCGPASPASGSACSVTRTAGAGATRCGRSPDPSRSLSCPARVSPARRSGLARPDRLRRPIVNMRLDRPARRAARRRRARSGRSARCR